MLILLLVLLLYCHHMSEMFLRALYVRLFCRVT
jgi:hypothetical protein